MEVQYKDNGNILVDGKEFIPRERIESAIDYAVDYQVKERIKNVLLFVSGIVVGLVVFGIRLWMKH